MKTQLTISEIAEALNLSRNTVSKVLSSKTGVSTKTQNLVLNYINQPNKSVDNPNLQLKCSASKGFVVFSCYFEKTEYYNNILSNIEKVLKENGYILLLNIVRKPDEEIIPIPVDLYDETIKGVITFNIFNENYWNQIVSSKIPAVFIDTFHNVYLFSSKTDIITVEGTGSIHDLAEQLIQKGKKSFGYIGDKYYCYSTYQRWQALKQTLEHHSITFNESNCHYDDRFYSNPNAYEYAKKILKEMPAMPEVFFCSSDLYAILVSKALQEFGYKIPEDISIVGFDNWTETQYQTPAITTIDSHSSYIGQLSAQRLIERINNPDLPYEIRLCQTDVILRATTNL